MIYQGQVKNGVIVFANQPPLPDGTRVRIEPVPVEKASGSSNGEATGDRPWGEVFGDLVGKAKGLPPDMARNHDHYLHGAPRQ